MLELLPFHLRHLVAVSLFIYVTYLFLAARRQRSRIRQLGSFAPRIPNYLPFGIYPTLRLVIASWYHRDLTFWDWLFQHSPDNSKTVESRVGVQRYIFTADPENIKAILATQFHDYGKGKDFHQDWQEFLGDSIFTTDGHRWHSSRQLIRPQFIKERVKDLDMFESHVQKLIPHLAGKGQSVDVAPLFYRYTLDTSTDYLLGCSVGSLDSPQADFVEAFDEVQRVQSFIARVGPLNVFVPRRSFRRGLKKIDAFVQPFIDSVLRLNLHDLKDVENPTFLQAMASQGVRDRKAIRDQVVAVLLAGRDTTAGALNFLFLEMSRQPQIVQKLRREVLEKVGHHARPTYETLKDMRYLKNIVNEVLRLYPSVPFNIRSAMQDTTLPRGGGVNGDEPIGVLKGNQIGYSTLSLQRQGDLYPQSPEYPPPQEFNPDRWEKWQPKPWHYIPFNGGPRICIGQQFALTEIAYTVVRIMQRFERIECLTPSTGPSYKCEVVLSPVHGVHLAFTEDSIL